MSATVHHGMAADILPELLAPGSVDMVYLDPPFGTQLNWTAKAGSFSDKFAWDETAIRRADRVRKERPAWAQMLDVLPIDAAARAYLMFVSELLLELFRVLHPAGSLWLHCDDTMGAYIKLALAGVFGHEMLLGDVVWRRTAGAHTTSKSYARIHDTVVVVARSRASKWRLWRSDFSQGDPLDGIRIGGYIEDAQLNATSKERVGYPTQKSIALLERLVAAGSAPGDLVLDPTCGSGTTLVAARKLGRRTIGIDRSFAACRIAHGRLAELIDEMKRKSLQPSLFGEAA